MENGRLFYFDYKSAVLLLDRAIFMYISDLSAAIDRTIDPQPQIKASQ